MGPVAGRTAPAGARNRAGPRIGGGKRVAAVGAGRRARGPGRAQMVAAAAGIGLGRKRAASVLVSCFCKASLDCREERKGLKSLTPGKSCPLPGPPPWAFCCGGKNVTVRIPNLNPPPFPPPNIHSKGLSPPPAFLPGGRRILGWAKGGGYGERGWRWSPGDARPRLALAPEVTIWAHLPGNVSEQIPRQPKTQPQLFPCPGTLQGGWLPSCPSSQPPSWPSLPAYPLPVPSPLWTWVPALLPGDRYLEDTHSQRCVLLQLAVLAGGLGGLPGQAVFVPPAAQVLVDRQTDWEQDEEPKDPKTTASSPFLYPQFTHLMHMALEWPWEGEVRIGLRLPGASHLFLHCCLLCSTHLLPAGSLLQAWRWAQPPHPCSTHPPIPAALAPPA